MAFIDNYKAVLFDLDGCLVKSNEEYIYRITKTVVDRLKGRYDKSQVMDFWFEDFSRDSIVLDVFNLPLEDFWPEFNSVNRDVFKSNVSVYDDVRLPISKIRKKGLVTGILTGGNSHINEVKKSMVGNELFDCYLVANSLETIKSKSEGILKFLSDYKIDRKDFFYVGNSSNDVFQSKKAQVYSVIVDRNEYNYELFKKHVPDKVIKSLEELLV